MRISRAALVVLETAIVFSAALLQTPLLQPVRAQSSIPISQEYSSGDIQVYPYLRAWYTWVNINSTRTIFLALHSQQQSPVFSFVGQAYNTSSGSRVFVANALMAMEVFNDTNKNGFLDANYAAPVPTTELLYTLIMNASQTFTPSPVRKTVMSDIPHYVWGITYGSVQAILINATSPGYGYGGGMRAADTMIDHVSMFYDYSVSGNTTFLKTSYEIGSVTLVQPVSPKVTLRGLSLSLLHTTLTVSSRQLTVTAGSAPYDSQTNTTPSLVNVAQVTVDNILAYEFRFRDNYTLLTNPAANYPAVYEAAPSNSLPANAFQGQWFTPLIRVQDYVRGSLPDIAGLPATSNLNYNTSKFIYRVSYPTWSGYGLKHDPTYVAHLGSVAVSPPGGPSPPGIPLGILSVAIFTGLLALVVAVQGLTRARRPVQITDEPQELGPTNNSTKADPKKPN